MTNDILAQVQQIRQNPVQFLMQRRMNIPANISANPNAILNHLLATGQVSQQQVNAAYQAAQRYR